MSSSSTSDVDSGDCFCGGFDKTTTPWPMHPLIYYTHVPNRRKQSSRERKKYNPNCFVKAFRWYTQERIPCQKTNSTTTNTPDIKGFAMWLDEKYTEFLQDSQVARMRYTLKQTSTAEIDKVSNFNARDSCSSKKFKILKSPRKRRYKLTNGKHKGDILLRSNKSFEFILRPKNISRAASECFARQGSCCSNSTSSNIDKRIKAKTKSLTSVLVEKEVCSIPFEDVNEKVHRKSSRHAEDDEKIIANGEHKQKDNVSCQCLNGEIREHVDRYSQYHSNAGYKKSKEICACNWTLSPPQTQILQNNIIEHNIPPCKCADVPQKDPTTSLQNNCTINKHTSECTNDGTQTSDYPINLNTAHQYPLFMKIICLEKYDK